METTIGSSTSYVDDISTSTSMPQIGQLDSACTRKRMTKVSTMANTSETFLKEHDCPHAMSCDVKFGIWYTVSNSFKPRFVSLLGLQQLVFHFDWLHVPKKTSLPCWIIVLPHSRHVMTSNGYLHGGQKFKMRLVEAFFAIFSCPTWTYVYIYRYLSQQRFKF